MKHKISVLYAEDDDVTSKITIHMLEINNYEVTYVSNGQEAIDLFKKFKNKFDIVLCDYQMPRKNGEEVVQFIRNFSNIPIISNSSLYSLKFY